MPAARSQPMSLVAMIAWAYPGGGMIDKSPSGLISYRWWPSAVIIAVRSSSFTTVGICLATVSALMQNMLPAQFAGTVVDVKAVLVGGCRNLIRWSGARRTRFTLRRSAQAVGSDAAGGRRVRSCYGTSDA